MATTPTRNIYYSLVSIVSGGICIVHKSKHGIHSIAYYSVLWQLYTYESTTVQLKRLNLQQIPKDWLTDSVMQIVSQPFQQTALDIIMCTMHWLLHCKRESSTIHSCYYAMNHIALCKWIRGWWVVTRGGTATGGGCARDRQASSDKLPYRTSFTKTFTRLAE